MKKEVKGTAYELFNAEIWFIYKSLIIIITIYIVNVIAKMFLITLIAYNNNNNNNNNNDNIVSI